MSGRSASASAAVEEQAPSEDALLLEIVSLSELVRAIGTELPGVELSGLTRSDQERLLGTLCTARRLLDKVRTEVEVAGRRQVARNRRRILARGRKRLRVNLGSGDRELPGWVNIDLGSREFSQCLQWGLPFADGSVQYLFFAHALEHLYYEDEALAVLREIHRVLTPRGVARIVVPDIEKFLRAYVANDQRFFEHRKEIWAAERQARTPLEQLLRYCGASSPPHGFFWHKWGYDFPTLKLLLEKAGFASVKRSQFMRSRHTALRVDASSDPGSVQHDGDSYSLFVEVTR